MYNHWPKCEETERDTGGKSGVAGGKEGIHLGGVHRNSSKFKQEQQWADQSAKRRRLMASVVYISQHKQLRAAAFVPVVELLLIPFLFRQLRHNAGVGLALTGRVCAVCR